MSTRVWPMRRGLMVTSGFRTADRPDHWGIDIGWPGGSAGLPVFAAQAGICTAGPAQGFGQWVLVDHPTEAGGGLTVYGHIIPEVVTGQWVEAGQRIAQINPDPRTNGGVPPHLHFEVHRYRWSYPGPDRLEPLAWLDASPYAEDPPPGAAPPAIDDEATWAAIAEQQMGPPSA